jgi:hypothetical protein
LSPSFAAAPAFLLDPTLLLPLQTFFRPLPDLELLPARSRVEAVLLLAGELEKWLALGAGSSFPVFFVMGEGVGEPFFRYNSGYSYS